MQAARLRNQIEKTQTTQVVKGITHFLLFPDRRTAEHAKQLAEDAGFEAILTDNGNGFTVKVPQGAPLKEEYVEHVTVQLSEIAQKTGGTYDAWETALG
jgi:hypothetical protein